MKTLVLRALAVWAVLIVAESIHGTVRELWLKPALGDWRARQVCVFTGTVIILGIAYRFSHWIQADTPRARWLVGLMWVALTIAFEVVLGRLVLGYPWERLFEDYDITRGGLLAFGMLVLLLSPHLAARAHESRVRRVRAIEESSS